MSGHELEPEVLDAYVNTWDAGDECQRCGIQLFDDFWVCRLRYSNGRWREVSLCTFCYGAVRDASARLREQRRADELVDGDPR